MDRGFARRFILMDELTEELHRSEKAAYEKLIRMMSHEVNNTAGAVSSLLESCLAYREQLEPADRDDFAEALSVAISRTGRMNRFMQEFADVVRLPAPRKRPATSRDCCEEVVRLVSGAARDPPGRAGSGRFEADSRRSIWIRPRWSRPSSTSCKNALEAIGEDGTITVRLGLDGGRPFVAIRDNGGGIPPEVREHLFTPFFTSKENGQGIGLTMVQEILLGHGFDFSLENDGDGVTEFKILF